MFSKSFKFWMIEITKTVFWILILSFLISCSSNSGGTTKLQGKPFVSKLYGTKTKTIAIDLKNIRHIDWMGLNWSAEYKYFTLLSYDLGQGLVEIENPSSSNVIKDLDVVANTNNSETIPQANSGVGYFTIRYSPTEAIESDKEPHKGYFLIQDGQYTIRVEFLGYTEGMCDDTVEECNFSGTGGLSPLPFKAVNNQIFISICHPDIEAEGLGNVPENPKVRRDPVEVTDEFIFYLSNEDENLHIVRSDNSGLVPSIPAFDIPMPEGSEISQVVETLPAEMRDNQNVSCSIDETGSIIDCGEGVAIDLLGGNAGVEITGIQITNGTIEPTTSVCPDFGSVTGSGTINDDTMTVVGFSEILSNPLNLYINGLVVVEVPLEAQ